MNNHSESESVRTIEVEFVQKRPYWWTVVRKPKWPNGHPEYPKTYEHCGTDFVATRYEQRFCTASCASTHNERKKGNRPKVTLQCATCGNEFQRYNPPSADGLVPKYCSRECFRKQIAQRLITSDNIEFKKVLQKKRDRAYMNRYRKTEIGKAKRRLEGQRAYLKRKSKT